MTYSDKYEAYDAGEYWYKVEGGGPNWIVRRYKGPPIGSINNLDHKFDEVFTSKEAAHEAAAKWARSWKENQS